MLELFIQTQKMTKHLHKILLAELFFDSFQIQAADKGKCEMYLIYASTHISEYQIKYLDGFE